MALTQGQLDRLSALRASIMTSSPVRLAAAKLAELQAVPPPGNPAAMRGGRGGQGGGGSPVPTGAGSAQPAGAAAAARLTAEVAAIALALNNLQLAVACVARLRGELEGLAASVFGAAAVPGAATANVIAAAPDDEGARCVVGRAAATSTCNSPALFPRCSLPFPTRCSRDGAKVRTCLAGLGELQAHLKRSLDTGLAVLVSARLVPRLRAALGVFESTTSSGSAAIAYDLTEDAFAAGEEDAGAGNAFVSELLPMVAATLAPYQVRPEGARQSAPRPS